jgi:hypothetical protein
MAATAEVSKRELAWTSLDQTEVLRECGPSHLGDGRASSLRLSIQSLSEVVWE